MSCRARQYQMSLSLDGRLSSGRRAELLRHIGDCSRCTQAWHDIHATHETALRAPTYAPSPGFREALRRRIESGEAAPEVTEITPIPVGTKVRYVLTGAAAAAALLAVVHLAFDRPQAEVSPSEQTAHAAIQNTTPRTSPPGMLGAIPVSEAVLAQTCVEKFAESATRLREHTSALGNELADSAELAGLVTDLRTTVGVMRWLDRKEMIELPSTFRGELQEADHFLEQAESKSDWGARRLALLRLRDLELERVQNRLRILCCREPNELASDIEDLVMRIPQAQQILRFYRVEELDVVRRLQPQGPRFFKVEIRSEERR